MTTGSTIKHKKINRRYFTYFTSPAKKRFISGVLFFCIFLGVGVGEASAVVKVLSNSRHAYSVIRNTVTQLLGSGHLDVDVIVHSTYLDNTYSGSPSIALYTTRTFYDGAGNAVPSQAPYQLYTSSFTGYTGDTVALYNQYDGVDLAHNYAFTKSTNGPPPIFHIAPGGDGWASKSGVEWTIDASIFATNSLSALTASNPGILASLRHNHPTWNWFDIKAALRQTGTNWDTGYDDTSYGFGQVNYASSTAFASNQILLQPPVSSAVVSATGQVVFTLYPFKQTRRVKEVLFQFDSDPSFQANELTLSDITTLGGTKVAEYSSTKASSSIKPIYTAFSNKYFVWFTSDNVDDSSANFSRIDTYSVLGPLSQARIDFNSSFDISSPVNNAISSTLPNFTWDDAESYFNISKYQLFIDGVLDTDNITSTSTTPSSALSEGSHTWYVKAFNGSGNATSSISTRTFNVLTGYTTSQTWYVDNVLGDDSNSGTEAAPWKTLTKASDTAQAGNTVIIVKNEGVPYREGVFSARGNTTDGDVVFRGVDANSKPEIWGSKNVSQSFSGGWTAYVGGNPNTYQKAVTSSVSVLLAGSATSTLSKRTWKLLATSLNEGEWYYTGGTLYYRLKSGEDINTLHVEAGSIGYGLSCTLRNTFKDIIVKYANTAGVFLGAGCTGERLEIYDSGGHGVSLRGNGSSKNNPGPILRHSVVAGSYARGISLSYSNYVRLYGNVVYDNGVGLYVELYANDAIIKNNIFINNNKNIRFNIFSSLRNFIASNNNWASGSVDSSWTSAYKGSNNQASTTPLIKDAANRNFRLKKLSPNIDSGTSISGVTTDILGNPIYGTPDIGAYEYQPPYTIGTNKINISGGARLYADGKYRYTSATSSADTANLTIRPQGGWGSGDYSEYLNISVSKWNTSGDYSKTWTENSSSATTTVHTIGDLKPNTYYVVKVDDSDYVGALSDESGQLAFDYSGGYSSHTFNLDEDTVSPDNFTLVSPLNNKAISADSQTLSWNASSDLSGIAKYQLFIDGTLDVDDIASTSTSVAPSTEFSCGSHSWYVRAVDNAGNTTNSTAFDIVRACGGGIFTGSASSLPGYVKPREQTIYPNGNIVYADDVEQSVDVPKITIGQVATTTTTISPEQEEESQPSQIPVMGVVPVSTTTKTFLAPIFASGMMYGSYGDEVVRLQEVLRERGFFTYPENTGYFGKITEEAVKAFQKVNGIEQVGIVGPKTRSALNNIGNTNKTTQVTPPTIPEIQNEISRLQELIDELMKKLRKITDR